MNHVFISHGTSDRKRAEGLCAWLEAHGIVCWMAPRDISSGNYAGEITRALKTADVVVVICSKASCKSEHVKNEVTLAFNNAKLLLPYFLDEDPLDDDLEYYLSSKQRIMSCGDARKDFTLIEHIIKDFRGEHSAVAAQMADKSASGKNLTGKILAAIVFTLIVCGAFFLLRRPTAPSAADTETAGETPTTALSQIDSTPTPSQAPAQPRQQPIKAQAAAAEKSPVTPKNSYSDTFSGRITDGYPDGPGRYTFKRARLIDAHDEKGRMASAGDYIEGMWTRGHLNYGEWYGADGIMKEFIQLGDNPDTASDQKFGACARP